MSRRDHDSQDMIWFKPTLLLHVLYAVLLSSNSFLTRDWKACCLRGFMPFHEAMKHCQQLMYRYTLRHTLKLFQHLLPCA